MEDIAVLVADSNELYRLQSPLVSTSQVPLWLFDGCLFRSNRSLPVDDKLDSSSSMRMGLGVSLSIAAVSTAGATPDVIWPTAAMFISFRPFEKRRIAPCIPAIPQSPLKCGRRGVRYGATDTPMWLEAAAVWTEEVRALGGRQIFAALLQRTSERKSDTATDSDQQRDHSMALLGLSGASGC